MKKILFIALSLITCSAHADQWFISSLSADHCTLANFTDVTKEGDVVSFWTLQVDKSQKPYDYLLVNIEVDCRKKRYNLASANVYKNNKPLEHVSLNTNWKRISPGSNAAIWHDAYCKKKSVSPEEIPTIEDAAFIAKYMIEGEDSPKK